MALSKSRPYESCALMNLNELKQRCEDEKAQIAPQQCERVIKSHQKELLPVYLSTFYFSHTASAFLSVFVK